MDESLEHASREQLLELIASLQAQVKELQDHIIELEARPGGPPSGRQVPAFVKGRRQKEEVGKPRKSRAQAFVRRLEQPTRQVEHALDTCQGCGTRLLGGSVKRRRQVLHIPIVPVEVIEHVYIERRCPICSKRNVPKAELEGEVIGQNRLSTDTMALIASLHEVARMPLEQIQWLLESLYKLKVSVGEIVRVLHVVAQKAAGTVAGLLEELRSSRLVHADETGWREDGANGYLWSFSNEKVRYFLCHESRSSEVVRRVLREEFSGVLVSDFYGAYNCLDGPHQRCWVHLLRDVHVLCERHAQDEALQQWAGALRGLYLEAKATSQRAKDLPRHERAAARQALEERLLGLASPHLKADVPQKVLCQRIERFLPELLTFVELPWVPSDNNAAERAIRAQVVARKISGGTRSPKGSATKAALATVFATWRLRGLNPLLACRLLLNSP